MVGWVSKAHFGGGTHHLVSLARNQETSSAPGTLAPYHDPATADDARALTSGASGDRRLQRAPTRLMVGEHLRPGKWAPEGSIRLSRGSRHSRAVAEALAVMSGLAYTFDPAADASSHSRISPPSAYWLLPNVPARCV